MNHVRSVKNVIVLAALFLLVIVLMLGNVQSVKSLLVSVPVWKRRGNTTCSTRTMKN